MAREPDPETAVEPAEAGWLLDTLTARGELVERVVTTHVSVLAMTATRVYKAKRHVCLPFVDLSTADARECILRDELALNRRLAPDVYVAVERLVGAAGAPEELVLVMRRLPDECRLAAVVTTGDGRDCVEAVARAVARFHAGARRGADVDALATRDAITALWHARFEQWRPFAGRVLDGDTVARVELLADEYLAGRTRLFDARIAGGRVVDGHGDLLADDVFCLDDGPRILDCLEFSDALRFGDVLADVAFLAMDLERLGRADLAAQLLDAIARDECDAWPASLADHYIAYRAHVRAKVACIRAISDADAASARSASALLEIARTHLERGRVHLVLVGGLPGTGKTTVAAGLARELGAVHLRSDVVRKQLAGIAACERAPAPFGAGIYDAATTAATYRELCDRAAALLAHGSSVVLDATWETDEARKIATAMSREASAHLVAIECRGLRDVVAARLAARAARGHDASDADLAVYDAMALRFVPWPDASPLETDAEIHAVVSTAVAAVRSGH